MKQFFTTFFLFLLPLLILTDVIEYLLPPSIPYGVFIISRLGIVLIGSVIAITVLKRKHNSVNFGYSFLAGFTSIIIGYILSALMYNFIFEMNYSYALSEVLLTLLLFTFFQNVILLMVLLMAGKWYTIKKAGKPGISMFIPFYNIIVQLQMAKKPVWWFFSYFRLLTVYL